MSMNETIEKPVVKIEYCPKCKWLLRAAWMGQELLSTFEEELGGVLLKPSDQSGLFRVFLNGTLVWDRQTEKGFPDAKELKQRVRDVAFPQKQLGHGDVKH